MYKRRRPLPTKPAAPPWKWALAVLLALLLVGGGWLDVTWPRNPEVQMAATVRTVTQDWATLQGFGPRPVGTASHDAAADWLRAQFTALGYRVTEQPVTLERPFDHGGTVQVGELTVPAAALYGAGGGEQTGRLVRVSAAASRDQMEEAGLRGQIALVALDAAVCGSTSWSDLADRATGAGAFGVVLVDACQSRQLRRVNTTPLPLVEINAPDGQKVLKLAGQQATVTSDVEFRQVVGHNLIAARVNAVPEVVFGAHLDSVNRSPGANDNASGVLGVLEAARQASSQPLADRAWFVLFDAEEDGLYGSNTFARDPSYPIRETRAMLNLDMVGVAAAPLGLAGDAELLTLARRLRPNLRIFKDDARPTRETFGRTRNLTGSSDHVSFMRWGVRTAFLHRGLDDNYHSPGDMTLNPALVQDTADFALKLAERVLETPWTPHESCGITGRDCRN
ncbi:M28 family metallopeptidase [Deinococcus marmoris]|uniref:Aminopeptidase n=1 Tax=Deinococcus marmoris TaxID=249408 RepID=A0A1U7P1V2_9DEIO|nr:M28 family metallopeptidase [Deinococcus marmoris]OLV19152.1 aminopeptidase [Deinococcus marmoris]